MAFSRLFTLLGSKPKTRTGNKFPKAKDLTFKVKAKAKDTIGWPRGASRPRPCPRGLQLCQGRMHAGDRHRWSVKPPFGSTRRHVFATNEDRIWPTQFPRRSSSCLERASNSSPLNHHFSSTVQSWVEDLPLQPGVLHRQPLRTFVEECIDLLTYLLTYCQ